MRTLWMVIVCSAVIGFAAEPVRAGTEEDRTASGSGDPVRALRLWKPLAARGTQRKPSLSVLRKSGTLTIPCEGGRPALRVQ